MALIGRVCGGARSLVSLVQIHFYQILLRITYNHDYELQDTVCRLYGYGLSSMSPRFTVPIILRALESHDAVATTLLRANASASAWEALSTRQIGDVIVHGYLRNPRATRDENLTVREFYKPDERRIARRPAYEN